MFTIDKLTALKQYFGHSQFRPGQEELVEALLAGQDALGVMPTGAGKSVCYQLPALLLPGLTVVVSPLISLMKDQVTALIQAGVSAAYINSTLSPAAYQRVCRQAAAGDYKIIYVAPERLLTQDFLQLMQQQPPALVAVDEAHCVSQWGQDFRPSYLKIADFVAQLPQRPPVGAFTATATAAVKQDIEEMLALRWPCCITTGFDRPNLFFEVARPKNKTAYLRAFVAERPRQSGIVYCATRRVVEEICQVLQQSGVAATRYHAGLDDEERRRNQEDFEYDRARVMVAANAFGMGIDKSNIGFVVHYNMPKNVESYYQEAGRAGRDGEKAHCVLLFSPGDVQTAKYLIYNASETEGLSPQQQQQVRQLDLQRLAQMTSYCTATGCLRAFLLAYFGETAPAACDNCGNCAGEMVMQDITVEAQKILSAVARIEKKYPYGLGMLLVARMLHGSREQRVLQLGLDALPTYGTLADTSQTRIREYMDCLVKEGYLSLTSGEYPVVHTAHRAREVLFDGKTVQFTSRRASRAEKAASYSKAAPVQEVGEVGDQGLFERLRALRSQLAQRESIPAYMVFSNAALVDMAARRPGTLSEFLQVSGVGEAKAAHYGQAFLDAIAQWQAEA